MHLAEHRAGAAHLPHQPFDHLVAAFAGLRHQLAGLVGEIDQDRARLHQRQVVVAIDDRRDAVVGRDLEEVRRELFVLADVDRRARCRAGRVLPERWKPCGRSASSRCRDRSRGGPLIRGMQQRRCPAQGRARRVLYRIISRGSRDTRKRDHAAFFSRSAFHWPSAASPFILARCENARCAAATFSALPFQVVCGACCSARP